MNKMIYKQKRKAVNNKENRDEENKINKNNIKEMLIDGLVGPEYSESLCKYTFHQFHELISCSEI
jgi:hypothetical protein